jgi:putative thiamine transport system ATP-binding protein
MTGAGMTSLELRQVTIRHNDEPLFAPLSLAVSPGRPVTIMGPSGAGKSSLLAWMTGMLPEGLSGSGDVRLDGSSILGEPPNRRRLGILFQDDLLFPHMSVGENLGFALPSATLGRDRRTRIAAALDEAELPAFIDRDPATLSGGQRARVALLRILLSAPKALLLDEPFSKLDLSLRDRFRSLVFQSARHLPVLLVSHDPADAPKHGEIVQLQPYHKVPGIS